MRRPRLDRFIHRLQSRRSFLAACAAAPGALIIACSGDSDSNGDPTQPAASGSTSTAAPATDAPQALQPTPSCTDDDEVTPDQTEGPFFTPDSPERASLREDGIAGTPLTITGAVLATDCTPLANALLDFWQADNEGVYDNSGYRLRGHQFTDGQGRYTLETIVPGLYPGRTRHVHVKVQAENNPVLTTQLYFPGEPDNESDGIFDTALLMDVQGESATFDFVLDVT
jgi:protocatechuate 3,4-dioxygenase beta subunit